MKHILRFLLPGVRLREAYGESLIPEKRALRT